MPDEIQSFDLPNTYFQGVDQGLSLLWFIGDVLDPIWGTITKTPFYLQVTNMVNFVPHSHDCT